MIPDPGLAVAAGLLVLGVVITMVPKRRAAAEQESCKNNLKGLALFASWHSHPLEKKPVEKMLPEILAGTIIDAGIPRRTTWPGW